MWLDVLFGQNQKKLPASKKLPSKYNALYQLKEQRSFINVMINDNVACQGTLECINPSANYFSLVDLYPKPPQRFITPHSHFQITAHHRLYPVNFTTHLQQVEQHEEDWYYFLQLPDNMYAQRREAFRVTLDGHLKSSIGSLSQTDQIMDIIDVSVTGIRLRQRGYWMERIEQGDILPFCELQLSNHVIIPYKLEIKRIEFSRSPYRHTLIGGAFRDMPNNIKIQLEHFIAQQQRQYLRSQKIR